MDPDEQERAWALEMLRQFNQAENLIAERQSSPSQPAVIGESPVLTTEYPHSVPTHESSLLSTGGRSPLASIEAPPIFTMGGPSHSTPTEEFPVLTTGGPSYSAPIGEPSDFAAGGTSPFSPIGEPPFFTTCGPSHCALIGESSDFTAGGRSQFAPLEQRPAFLIGGPCYSALTNELPGFTMDHTQPEGGQTEDPGTENIKYEYSTEQLGHSAIEFSKQTYIKYPSPAEATPIGALVPTGQRVDPRQGVSIEPRLRVLVDTLYDPTRSHNMIDKWGNNMSLPWLRDKFKDFFTKDKIHLRKKLESRTRIMYQIASAKGPEVMGIDADMWAYITRGEKKSLSGGQQHNRFADGMECDHQRGDENHRGVVLACKGFWHLPAEVFTTPYAIPQTGLNDPAWGTVGICSAHHAMDRKALTDEQRMADAGEECYVRLCSDCSLRFGYERRSGLCLCRHEFYCLVCWQKTLDHMIAGVKAHREQFGIRCPLCPNLVFEDDIIGKQYCFLCHTVAVENDHELRRMNGISP